MVGDPQIETSQRTTGARAKLLCLGWIGISLGAGWFVPDFYDWTGADQSRPAPIVPKIALAIVVVNVVLSMLLTRVDLERDMSTSNWPLFRQLTLRQLLVVTAVVAAIMAIGQSQPFQPFIGVGLYVAVSGSAMAIAVANPGSRWLIATLWACQAAPFLWIVRDSGTMYNIPAFFLLSVTLPALLPTAAIAQAFGVNLHQVEWLSGVLGAMSLYLGLWLILCGPRRAMAYVMFITTVSLFSSFAFHAVMRA